jgi:hypothetical protein
MPFTYYAPNLNRIPNAFFIAGNFLPRETYESTAIYNYRKAGIGWDAVRSSAAADTVSGRVAISNRFISPNYGIDRTGIQFETTWGIVPVGMVINFFTDGGINLPFKIKAFKGTTSILTGDPGEYKIPLDEGLVPFSDELEVTAEGDTNLYFNQTAMDAFLANPNQNVFILGEYDYNNIEPTTIYTLSNSDPSATSLLVGQE